MLNRLNSWGWLNLIVRTGANFGYLALLARLGSEDDVRLWLLVITILAAANTMDALLGQYFIRSFAWTPEPDSPGYLSAARLQNQAYIGASAIALGGAAYLMRSLPTGTMLLLATLIGAQVWARRLDSRTRATSDLTSFQRTEVLLFSLGLVVGTGVYLASRSVAYLMAIHLTVLLTGVFVKYYLLFGSMDKTPTTGHRSVGSSRADLGRTVVVAIGGALTVNICLLIVSDGLDAVAGATLLLSYRLAMLVAEFASVPIVTRVPHFARLGAQAMSYGRLWAEFRGHAVLALGLCTCGLVAVALLARPSFRLLSLNLDTFGASPLGWLLVGAWLVERFNAYLSQLLMSVNFFGHAVVYALYTALLFVGAAMARVSADPSALVVAQLLGMALAAPVMLRFSFRVIGHPTDD